MKAVPFFFFTDITSIPVITSKITKSKFDVYIVGFKAKNLKCSFLF